MTGRRERRFVHGKMLAYGVLGVIAQALAIRDGHQKELEGCGLGSQVFKMAITDQAMIQPVELRGNGADAVGTDWILVNHWGLLGLRLNR